MNKPEMTGFMPYTEPPDPGFWLVMLIIFTVVGILIWP